MKLRPHIALDLGTDTTRGRTSARKVICPSVVLRDATSQATLAVGAEANEMDASAGRQRIRPITAGVMTDYPAGRAVISHAFDTLLPWWTLLRPTVIMNRSQLASRAQIQQTRQAVRFAGASEVFAADTTALAALGVGIDPTASKGSLVVDIGAGGTEAAVITRGSPSTQSARSVGGQDLIQAVRDFVADTHSCTISASTAQTLLADIGSAVKVNRPEARVITEEFEITTNDIVDAVDSVLTDITELLRDVMQSSSAALLSDVADQGITLVGGVAQLDNLDTRLQRRLSVPTTVADDPAEAVVRGGLRAQKYMSVYREFGNK